MSYLTVYKILIEITLNLKTRRFVHVQNAKAKSETHPLKLLSQKRFKLFNLQFPENYRK